MNRYKEEFFNKLLDKMKYKDVFPSVKDEMNNHMEELSEDLMAKGIAEEDANKEAVRRMGSPEEIAESLNITYEPVIDKRMLALTIALCAFSLFFLIGIDTGENQYHFSSKLQIITI